MVCMWKEKYWEALWAQDKVPFPNEFLPSTKLSHGPYLTSVRFLKCFTT